MPRTLLFGLTLLLSGRAMTLAFVGRAGGGGPGDPPAAWLMPLLGDALVGLTGLAMLPLVLRGRSLWAWTALVSWNVVAIWDALSAYVVHTTNPWPEFFMIEAFGSSMFFMAASMHLACLVLVTRPAVKRQYFA